MTFRDPVGDMVAAAIAAESAPAPTAPAPPASSLAPSVLETKAELEAAMARSDSDYWRGPHAARNQALYRDILRGEQMGATEAVGPEHADMEVDHPSEPGGYRLDLAAGSHSISPEQRDTFDSFAKHAHARGFGNEKVVAATGVILTGNVKTVDEFKSWAVSNNWSDRSIEHALDWYRTYTRT